ncbi:MAG: hypothetical protein ACOYM2_00275 [Rectinemataceae bacterium]
MIPIHFRAAGGLCIRVPRNSLRAAGRAVRAGVGEGLLFDGTEGLSVWSVSSSREEGDELLLFGPDFEGSDLDTALSAAPDVASSLALIEALARAFRAMLEARSLPSPLLSPGILVSTSQAVLVLPPYLVSKAVSASATTSFAEGTVPVFHSRQEDAGTAASRFLALAVYRLASGREAFPATEAEKEGSAGTRIFLPLSLAAPSLDPGLSALVDRVLADPRGTGPADWVAALSAARIAGPVRPLPEREAAAVERRRRSFESRAHRTEAARRFLGLNKGALAAALVGLMVTILVVANMSARAAALPDLSALPPRDVSAAYYRALDALDPDLLEAASSGQARDKDSRYLAGLTVLGRARMAMEGEDPMILAGEWLKAGSPSLPEGKVVHGITDLVLGEPGTVSPSEALVEARYRIWTMGEGSPPAPISATRHDRLQLRHVGQGWKIFRIEREGG